MASHPIKWFDNRFHGLPVMNGTPGCFTAILDACLVNGFGDTNIVTVTVTNKRAVIILQDGVTFFKKTVVGITGFSNQALNTEYKVIDSDIGRLTIDIDLPDGPLDIVGGVVKYAPLGWFKPFSSVSRGIYKPSKVDALKWMFYMDDTAAQWAEVKLVEDATSIDVHVGSRPSNYTYRWNKSETANTVARNFNIIGDSYCFYWKTNRLTSDNNDRNFGALNFVGEGVKLTTNNDQFAVYLTGQYSKNNRYDSQNFLYNPSWCCITLRYSNGIKGDCYSSVNMRNPPINWSILNKTEFYSDDQLVTLFTDNYFIDNNRRITKIPGLVIPNGTAWYDNFDYVLEAKDNTLDKDLLLMRLADNINSQYNSATIYFDITGPWR